MSTLESCFQNLIDPRTFCEDLLEAEVQKIEADRAKRTVKAF